MGKVIVNGMEFDISDGASVSVINGEVLINGRAAVDIDKAARVTIEIRDSTVGVVRADRGDVTVTGDVMGSVQAGTGVTCGNVGGDVRAGTSVTCGAVAGSVKAGVSVRHG